MSEAPVKQELSNINNIGITEKNNIIKILKSANKIFSKIKSYKKRLEFIEKNITTGDDVLSFFEQINKRTDEYIKQNKNYVSYPDKGNNWLVNNMEEDHTGNKTKKYVNKYFNKYMQKNLYNKKNIVEYNNKLNELDDNLIKLTKKLNETYFGQIFETTMNFYVYDDPIKMEYKNYGDISNKNIYYHNKFSTIKNIYNDIKDSRNFVNSSNNITNKISENLNEFITNINKTLESDLYDPNSNLYLPSDIKNQEGGYFSSNEKYSSDIINEYHKLYTDNILKLSECRKKYNILINKIGIFFELLIRFCNFHYYLLQINQTNYIGCKYISVATMQFYYNIINEILEQIKKGKNKYFDVYHFTTLNYLKFNIAPFIKINHNLHNINNKGIMSEYSKTMDFSNAYVQMPDNINFFYHFRTLLDKWIMYESNRISVNVIPKDIYTMVFPDQLNLNLFPFISGNKNVHVWINDTMHMHKITKIILQKLLDLMPYDICEYVKINLQDIYCKAPYIASSLLYPNHDFNFIDIIKYNYFIDITKNIIKNNIGKFFTPVTSGKGINLDFIEYENNAKNYIRKITIKIKLYDSSPQSICLMFPNIKKYKGTENELFPEDNIKQLNKYEGLKIMYAEGAFDERNSFEFIKWVNANIFINYNNQMIEPTRTLESVNEHFKNKNEIAYWKKSFNDINFVTGRSKLDKFVGKMADDSIIWFQVNISYEDMIESNKRKASSKKIAPEIFESSFVNKFSKKSPEPEEFKSPAAAVPPKVQDPDEIHGPTKILIAVPMSKVSSASPPASASATALPGNIAIAIPKKIQAGGKIKNLIATRKNNII
jgi:hypothetical protein